MKSGKLKSTVLAVLAVMFVIVSGSFCQIKAQTYGDYEYVIAGDRTSVEISGYSGDGGDIIIPDVIDGKYVTGIRSSTNYAGGVFYKKGISSVVIPSTMKYIGEHAFYENDIAALKIPDGTTTIGRGAFAFNEIESLDLGEGVTAIGYGAFGYNKLKNLEIPDGVTSIGNFAFNANMIESLEIGSGVVKIEHGAFESNKLTSVEIPQGVTGIANMAFARNSISSAQIPESATSIGSNSFSENQADPKDLTVYGKPGSQAELFANSNGYTFKSSMTPEYTYEVIDGGNEIKITAYNGSGGQVEIPEEIDGYKVTVIGRQAFSSKSIEKVTIPESVREIEIMAFQSNQISSLKIPDSVESIGVVAFSENEISSLYIGRGLKTIGSRAFESNQLESIAIPDNVQSINHQAFLSNKISKAIIPKTVSSIDSEALDWNQSNSSDLVVYGQSESRAESLSTEKGYTFEEMAAVTSFMVRAKDGVDSVDMSESLLIYAAPRPQIATYRDVTWSVEAISGTAKIDQTGLLTPLSPGKVTVKATARDGSGSTGTLDVTISASELLPNQFSDVNESDWFYDTVSKLSSIGGISGYPDGTFRPMDTMKRGEYLVLVMKLLGEVEENATGEHWAMNYSSKAYEMEILEGEDIFKFQGGGLDSAISRNEAAKISVRAVEYRSGEQIGLENLMELSSSILDFDSIPESYRIYVLKSYSKGLLSGYPDGKFKGGDTLNRAEAATVALRVFEYEK